MPKKNSPAGNDSERNSPTRLFSDEDMARTWLESKRWPNGPVCPRCGCLNVYTLKPRVGSKSPVRPGVYKCSKCRKQFTVRVGTILEESPIPICKWLMVIRLMTSRKKGVSSHQIARECGITQKSAWFMNHRIREAMKEEPMASMLKGALEVGETNAGKEPLKQAGEHKRGHNVAFSRTQSPEERFVRLATEWKRDTLLMSKVSTKVAHPAYLKIIGMGPAAVPFILEDLAENGPRHWFLALNAITEENPVPADKAGDMVVMTEAWLRWGRENGYLTGFQRTTASSFQT